MYIERVLSINEGWSILTTQKPQELADIQAVLTTLDDDLLLESISSSEKDTGLGDNFLAFSMHAAYNARLIAYTKWSGTLPPMDGQVPLSLRPKAIQNGVLAYIVGSSELTGGGLLTSLYLQGPYYQMLGLVDVTVILIPTSKTSDYLLNLGASVHQVNSLPTEEVCRAIATGFTSLNSQAPTVLAFFSPTTVEEIAVEEAALLKVGEHTIERTIEFAPEFYQAGVGLLSYFGEVLRQKDPSTKAKVRIEQEGNTVRLHIVPPVGEAEIVEKQLEQFALVISEQASPETLFSNQAHIIQLKSQLEMARLQVQTAQEIKQITDGVNAQRFATLEKQVESLNVQLAAQLLQNNKVIDLATQQASRHERMQAALLTHGQLLFKDMLEESRGNFQLLTAIQSLHQNLLSGLTTIEVEDQIKQALETVKQQKPGLLARIYSQVEGAALKAGASASLTWATDVIKHTIHPQ